VVRILLRILILIQIRNLKYLRRIAEFEPRVGLRVLEVVNRLYGRILCNDVYDLITRMMTF
jgi:hypothetical protein